MASNPEGKDPEEPSRDTGDEPAEAPKESSPKGAKGADDSAAAAPRAGHERTKSRDEAEVDDSEWDAPGSDDEGSDEDEDEDEDEEAERRRRLKAKARRKLKKKKKRPKPPLPKTEQELDAPNVQTLYMLGVLAAAVVIMAGAARFACNYHPDETKNPREVAAAELAKDPKDAALACQQAWATRNYARALEFAKGKAQTELQQAKQQCDADSGCAKQAAELSSKVLTTSEVLARQPTSALIRVRSTGAPAGTESFLLDLEQEGMTWKVAARRPDRGEPVPPTTVGTAPQFQIAPPMASGSPAPPATAPGKRPRIVPSKP